MIRLIPKHKHEDWMIRVGKIASTKEIIQLLTNPDQGKEFAKGLRGEAKKDLLHLLTLPITYSDYHGIGHLDTPYFIAVHDTFPPLTEAKVVEFNKKESK